MNKWLKRFGEDVKGESRPECPSASNSDENVERIRACVLKKCRLTLRKIAEELFPKTIVHEILKQNEIVRENGTEDLVSPEEKARG